MIVPESASNDTAWYELFKELVSRYTRSHLGLGQPLLIEPVEQSSRDTDTQDIEVTLSPDTDFWSSTGSADPQANEYLIYALPTQHLLSQVIISFYQALYQPGKPCYASQRVSISIGHEVGKYHYVSQEFIADNTPVAQTFTLYPDIVFGRFLRIDLLGKRQQQPGDDRLYSCVRWVTAHGTCVYALNRYNLQVGPMFPTLTAHLVSIVCSGIPKGTEDDMVDFLDSKQYRESIISGTLSSKDLAGHRLPSFYRSNESYMLRVILSTDISDLIQSYHGELTPLESVLLLEHSADPNLEYNRVLPCEETGDWFMAHGEFALARELYRRCHYLNGMVTSTLRLVLETSNFRNMLEVTLSQFTPLEKAHIISEAMPFYRGKQMLETAASLEAILRGLYNSGLITEDCYAECLRGPMTLPVGMRLVEFEKKPKRYSDYLFILQDT